MNETSSESNDFPVFLAYRTTDGAEFARRIHDALQDRQISLENGQASRIRVFWDAEAPANEDFHDLSDPALRACRALLLIVTPGTGKRRDGPDDLYRELDAWVEQNPGNAPIVLNTTPAEKMEWFPPQIKTNWPKINWESLSRDLAAEDYASLIDRVVASILNRRPTWLESEIARQRRETERQQREAERQQREAERLRALIARLRRSAARVRNLLVVCLAFAAVITFLAIKEASERKRAEQAESRVLTTLTDWIVDGVTAEQSPTDPWSLRPETIRLIDELRGSVDADRLTALVLDRADRLATNDASAMQSRLELYFALYAAGRTEGKARLLDPTIIRESVAATTQRFLWARTYRLSPVNRTDSPDQTWRIEDVPDLWLATARMIGDLEWATLDPATRRWAGELLTPFDIWYEPSGLTGMLDEFRASHPELFRDVVAFAWRVAVSGDVEDVEPAISVLAALAPQLHVAALAHVLASEPSTVSWTAWSKVEWALVDPPGANRSRRELARRLAGSFEPADAALLFTRRDPPNAGMPDTTIVPDGWRRLRQRSWIDALLDKRTDPWTLDDWSPPAIE